MNADVMPWCRRKTLWVGLALVLGAAVAGFLPAAQWVFDPLASDSGTVDEGATLPGEKTSLDFSPVGAPSGTLSLIKAVDLALGNNPQLKESWAQVKIQAAALGQARTAFLPTLTANGSRLGDGISYPGRRGTPRPTWVDSNQVSAAANWNIFNFGSGFFGDRAAGHLLEAALADHDAALQNALSRVIQAYFDAFTAREVYFGDSRDAEIARGTLASAKRREAKGAGTRVDTLEATTGLLKLLMVTNRDEGEYRKNLAVLVYELGLPTDTEIVFPWTLDDDLRYSGEDLRDWIAEAKARHPAIRSAERQVEAARDSVRAAIAGGLPSLGVSANYYWNGRPGLQLTDVSSNELLVAGTVTIPIFEGFVTLYKVHDAKARLEKQEAALDDVRTGVLRDVVKAYWDTNAAFQNLQASKDLLNAAQEGMTAARRRFDRNAANLIEVFNAQTILADARRERIRSLADWRSYRLRLVAGVGKLGREDIKLAQ